jgi:hypothetical protein
MTFLDYRQAKFKHLFSIMQAMNAFTCEFDNVSFRLWLAINNTKASADCMGK